MPVTAKRSAIVHDVAKQQIIERVGDLTGFEIAQNEVLVAIYMRDEMTPGGIVLPHQNLKEDLFQAKAHLVIKIGSACQFVRKNEKTGLVYGVPIKLHDWVLVKPQEAWSLDINTRPDIMARKDFVPCRLVYDDQIRAKLSKPGLVW